MLTSEFATKHFSYKYAASVLQLKLVTEVGPKIFPSVQAAVVEISQKKRKVSYVFAINNYFKILLHISQRGKSLFYSLLLMAAKRRQLC